MTPKEILYLFRHVFLPGKLPQHDDYNPKYESVLLDKVIEALNYFKNNISFPERDFCSAVIEMITRLKRIYNNHGGLDEFELTWALTDLGRDGGFLPIYIRAQNAGILMSKKDSKIHIESFELSPRNNAVIETLGRLKRDFPGPTLAMDVATFNTPSFLETMASALSKMSEQSVAGTMSKVKKARQEHDEDRDTTHPKMITEFFMSFLRPMCTNVETLQIQKNTRDEVMWLDQRHPWRRSSLWLFVRVILQLVFRRLSLEVVASDLYKPYMAVFMSTIIDYSYGTAHPEHVYMMNAKTARRLLKLDASEDCLWFALVQHSLRRSSDAITERWKQIISDNTFEHDTGSLKNLDFGKDTLHLLPCLDEFIEKFYNQGFSSSKATFEFMPQSTLLRYQPADLPDSASLEAAEHNIYNLAAFEAWIASHLDGWIQSHVGDNYTCSKLSALTRSYYAVAFPMYSGNPEAISLMLLTILELWIACDRSATYIHGLLNDYDACVPEGMFQSFLLPLKSQMERLSRAENYLCERRQRIKYFGNGIFKDFGTRKCFSVQYFDQSVYHQRLKGDIEDKAEIDRRRKEAEFDAKHQRYAELMSLFDKGSCENTSYNIPDSRFYSRETYHYEYSCKRCGYKREAEAITIDVHEWPLPTSDLKSKSTVFELGVPLVFGYWRDTTIFFLHDVLQMPYSVTKEPRAKHTLSTYSGLSPFFTRVGGGLRNGLLSEVKPHGRTHRGTKNIINVTKSDVCLDNGLYWKYFDDKDGCFVADMEYKPTTASLCTYKLPGRCSSLQQFLFRPAENCNGPTPNTVIAAQSSSPLDMSLGEYKALCTITLGVEIQWQNILLQLSMSSVDFKKVETSLFILQAINQAGPQADSSILRKAHSILDSETFSRAILERISEVSNRFENNWEFVHGLSTLIFLSLRVLSLSPPTVSDTCLNCLSRLRGLAFRWVNEVTENANVTNNDEQKNILLARSVHIALICAETFDCEGLFLETILANSSDAAIHIRCCMVVNDRMRVLPIDSDPIFPILIYRWQRLAHRCYPILADNIINFGCTSLDTAIKETWAAYCPSDNGWAAASDKNETWLVNNNKPQFRSAVHFNLLTGELLINGLPLSRLPSEYEFHEAYRRIFGRSLLEVMPSDVPRMQFSCQKQYMGCAVHLGKELVPGSWHYDLLIQATTKEHKTYEFVPQRLLAGCFPDTFVQDYVHWYDRDGDFVEFRSTKDPWLSSDSNWRLRKIESKGSRNVWQLSKDGHRLVNVKSSTANKLSKIFEPIEKSTKLHCIVTSTSSTLRIDIPRLRLKFSLQPGSSSIHSRQYRDMSIDTNQSLDTLVGLKNRLILAHNTSKDRLVLIPDGNVSCTKDGDHVSVNVGWQADSKVHPFSIDGQLGRLVDNGSLQSKLLLCYLHALTSFCLPDPLIQRTGTEQALSILCSASTRSFDQLQPENCKVLAKIANLTPERQYYPKEERVMQSVYWHHHLGYLAQHGSFYLEVVEIFKQDQQMGIFHPDTLATHPQLPCIEEKLLTRELIRSSVFRVSGFGAEDFTLQYDQCYESLDRCYDSPASSQVYKITYMVYNEIPAVVNYSKENLASCLWEFLSKYSMIHGPDVSFNHRELTYDAGFILQPTALISQYWCSIHKLLCSRRSIVNRFQFMIWLATLAFSKDVSMFALEILGSLYVAPTNCALNWISSESYKLQEGDDMKQHEMRSLISSAALSNTPESDYGPLPGEKYAAFKRRIAAILNRNREAALTNLLNYVSKQWPSSWPQLPLFWDPSRFPDYFDVNRVQSLLAEKFRIWYANREFRQYINNIASVIANHDVQPVIVQPMPIPNIQAPAIKQQRRFIYIDDLLRTPPDIDMKPPELPKVLQSHSSNSEHELRITGLLEKLALQSKSKYEKSYVEKLQSSIKSLQETKQTEHIALGTRIPQETLVSYRIECEKYSRYVYAKIISGMQHSGRTNEPDAEQTSIHPEVLYLLSHISHSPRVSPTVLLSQFNRHRWGLLPDQWKECLIAYGLSLTTLQQAKRLAALVNYHEEFTRELLNPGHSNWDPREFPESLLLEIENGILIRDVQEGIAQQMRSLPAGGNSVMQLNMGEGKSSVIVPIVATAFANKSHLVRVLVAKPQSRQMFQMLVSKLGGLLDRRVYHMPISRSLNFGENEAKALKQMCRECMSQGGVLLVQPEHILSLKLMCLESYIANKELVGKTLLKTLKLFKKSSRDIVDESDENFSVKFELVYTAGDQRPLELSPQRWIVIQQLLDLVRRYAPVIKNESPQSIEVDQKRSGSFPRIRLLHEHAGQSLAEQIAKHICDVGIDGLPVSRQSKSTRDAVYLYCLEPTLTASQIASVEQEGPGGFYSDSTRGVLLLVRGLLAGGVLNFCFRQKRWRVNYGPHPSRIPPTQLAVPYRAKDCPAQRSEFSHPDVVIVLTCLSYYYAGLCDDDLFLALQHLAKSDQADIEYQAWVRDAPGLSSAYRYFGGINLEDHYYCVQHIFPGLRFSKGAIDYFLSHIVYPKELKEFPDKLSASGWDIGEIKRHPTVGFSGTNDSRYTLPLSVKQLDLPEQNHTNALVLEYLLKDENTVTFIPSSNDPSISNAQLLLKMVTKLELETQVILEVGAQIIELSNVEVARDWLGMIPNNRGIHAVVFVNEDDEICVLDRNGRVEELQTSPFAKQLEACYIFLDEAHTRGIDLKLPVNYRAAVTLGPNITKDKLVQACMRMRKLGKGQSVIFCIPEEVKANILELSGKQDQSTIDVSDVLQWAISETWMDTRRSMPLWMTQGQRFEKQCTLWNESYKKDKHSLSTSQAGKFLEPESQTLEHRYRPRVDNATFIIDSSQVENQKIRRMLKRCHTFGRLNFGSTQLQEEQERELAPEIEEERQIEKPADAIPETHTIHPDLVSFVTTGILKSDSDAYMPAFTTLKGTSAASFLDVSQFPSELRVTRDFATTVKMTFGTSSFAPDSYQRPVQWILTRCRGHNPPSDRRVVKSMVIISPFEANYLLPMIRRSRKVILHIYAPRQNLAFSSLDQLTLYNVPEIRGSIDIPDNLRIQLALFAGQLYIGSYAEYQQWCDFLGVAYTKTPEGLAVANDGFILGGNHKTTFTKSPLKFLETLMSQIRKDCQAIDKTHVGKILNGTILSPTDFQPPMEIVQR